MPLVAAALAAAAVATLMRFASALPQDRPGARSLHRSPTPRIGGLAIWAGFVPVALIGPPAVPGAWGVWLAALAVVITVSLIDDFRGVHPSPRLAAPFAAAVALAAAILGEGPAPASAVQWLWVAAASVALVWAANLYNFMDGSDGLAALMGCCGFAVFGIAAWRSGVPAGAYLALAAATLPFLAVNVPPARMFMGDVGAVPLGFLAAALGLAGWRTGIWPAWFPPLVFLPYVADATVTLARRILRRERIWEPHRLHYYQRLHQLGAGHRGTLLAYGALMAGTGTSALTALAFAPSLGWSAFALWAGVMAALFGGIDYHWRHRPPVHR
jgi:UDP-N-acetylmuramyl pentapeptide phosphotransferase/UDP-N-acetylglucosamine-1-phosphate transferase